MNRPLLYVCGFLVMIRIDLLLLGPLLYLGTIGGLIGSIVGFRRTSSPTIHVNSLDQLENIRKAKES